jgi:hypothetical protein
MDEIDLRVRSDIERFGWHVALVPPDADEAGAAPTPGWGFTIGLLESFHHSELAVFGLDLEPTLELLNTLGARVRGGHSFAPDREYDAIFSGYPCAFRRIAPVWRETFFGNAAWHYKSPEVALLQCFWPDAHGEFPWQPGFDASLRAQQPLLYEARPEHALSPALLAALEREGAL